MNHVYESCLLSMNHVYESCLLSMSHVFYLWVMSPVHESCLLLMSHVSYSWVMSPIHESCLLSTTGDKGNISHFEVQSGSRKHGRPPVHHWTCYGHDWLWKTTSLQVTKATSPISIYESCPLSRSHVSYLWVMSPIYESCLLFMSHDSYLVS